jgi:predicted dehydrogenase/aryl-alcohol dehydrogenase-like predicted oxidoreductase
MTGAKKLGWGIVGAGFIARELADGINASELSELLAIASRDPAKSGAFGDEFTIPRRYGSYQAMLDDADVDAVYIAIPHPMHAEWAIKAIEAGKHLLVEKPLAVNAADAKAMIDHAEKHDVFLMEAFMYRCHPQMDALRRLLEEGVIGEIGMVRASFSYGAPFDPDVRAYHNDLAGGGIADVGCYPVSIARLIAGAVQGKPFLDPTEVKAMAHLCQTGVDAYAAAILRFDGDLLAEVSCGVGLRMMNAATVEIWGSDGRIFLPDPWCPSRYNRDPVRVEVEHYRDGDRSVVLDCPLDLYTYECDMVATHIEARQAPAMSWDDTIGNMETLDRWRADVGLVYEQETPARAVHTITHRPLVRRPDAPIPPGRIAGLDKPVSRLVQGCDSNMTMPHTSVMLDEYFACGGNVFDTSHYYGVPVGACERNLGQWISNRGVRDEVVVIEKGGNPPHGTPEGIAAELNEGLERLQMDSVDIWLMHRDNPDVPVGELVDVLNELHDAGRMTLFGASNWSLERLMAARAYAEVNGKAFFAVLSNQFSLAEMVANPFPPLLCLSCNTPAYRQWLAEQQLPVFSWSSTARGFFVDPGPGTPEIGSAFRSDMNVTRRRRAQELAEKKGVDAVTIALRWVLQQPFPTFPLFGAQRLRELWIALRAFEFELTEEEHRWLENGD